MPKDNLTITVDRDLLARAREAGLRPAALMQDALQTALGAKGEKPVSARLDQAERLLRSHGRKLGQLERQLVALERRLLAVQ